MVKEHPWMLVGPWYRWTRPGVPGSGRESGPVFQKFSTSNFVNEFLKQPQHSLKFDTIDQVYDAHFEPAPVFGAKHATLYPLDEDGKKATAPSRVTLVPKLPSGLRKLFLDTHHRYYLVVCELHCDQPGFPTAARDDVCQPGFVVRRTYVDYPEAAAPEAKNILREIVRIQAALAALDETSPLRPRAAKRRAELNLEKKSAGTFESERAGVMQKLADARGKLDQWKQVNGVRAVLQGWVPGSHPKIGQWQIVENEPEDLIEATFPLYPLFADPAISDHDAARKSIYFGVVPTSSLDSEANGKARFDDRSTYEIHCFVRRHKPGHARRVPPPDCCGHLTWSRPTERYRLASQFDLDGTSNQPITIQMPNLAELAAQAVSRPFGKHSPVKFIQPQGLQPVVSGNAVSKGESKGFQICFFSIPLITLIALFVLNIFLPIVVLLFNLWFLLAFKFCIPPSISVNAGLQHELDIAPPGVSLETSLSATVQGQLGFQVESDIADSNSMKLAEVQVGLKDLSATALADLNSNNVAVANLPKNVRDDPSIGMDFTAGLEFEVRRKPEVNV